MQHVERLLDHGVLSVVGEYREGQVQPADLDQALRQILNSPGFGARSVAVK